MAHVNRVKCVEISGEKIPVNFEEAHVNVVSEESTVALIVNDSACLIALDTFIRNRSQN